MLRGLQVFVSGIALAGFTLAGAAVASAQEAKPAPALTLEGDAAVITILIKADKTADFDSVLAKYKEALEKSENAVRKTQLAGMKFFKSAATAQGVPYIIVVDPVVKGEEYDITRIVTEVFPVEVQAVYQKYKDSFAGRGISALTKVQ
ncbi:MAG TPA: hypothetical protein VNT81_09905 [Vicinamibacterales bacterium]|nr:hypothetical protein [Vicinamibacterales bacterium]